MARGGYREGAGGKSTWKHGKTKPVRVPVVLAPELLEIARNLDEGKKISFSQEIKGLPVTESKVVDLTGIAVYHSKHGPVVRILDLLRAGYKVYPERLVKNLSSLAQKEVKKRGDMESFIEEFSEK